MLEPGLEDTGLLGAALYSDVVMDDARLAIAVARDAAAHGAEIQPWTEVIGARPVGENVDVIARDVLSGGERRITARAVVNAAGPWVDEVRRRLVCSITPGAPTRRRSCARAAVSTSSIPPSPATTASCSPPAPTGACSSSSRSSA